MHGTFIEYSWECKTEIDFYWRNLSGRFPKKREDKYFTFGH